MNENIALKKKENYEVQPPLREYLSNYSREQQIPIAYEDLMRYESSFSHIDKNGTDTLWETVYYTQESEEIMRGLTKIYVILKANGNESVMKHLSVDRIDYCSFGNSNPFRVRIINNYNDNYDYFYVKKADASRIYGLELEHILSPNRIGYIVCGQTLIEEHIVGIPGDYFFRDYHNIHGGNETRLAKEFIKFNERCFVKLLGDMRSYNFIIDVTQDFDDIQYRIRAIDFDQQSYEGRKNLYLPQYFKENMEYVQLAMNLMTPETVKQYQLEERAKIANRISVSRYRLKDLLDVMIYDSISKEEKVIELKTELAKHYENDNFLKCRTMGEIVKLSLWTVFH